MESSPSTTGPAPASPAGAASVDPSSAPPTAPPTPRRRPPTAPPIAERRTVITEVHGETRSDDYEWLREKDSPEVTAYLEAENAYTQQRTAHLAGLRQQIFDEIKARTRETDLSVPTRSRGHWYYGRSFEGKEYGASCRVPVRGPDDWTPPQPAEDCAPDQPALEGEELLLDLDALAEGHEYFSLGGSSVSTDGHLLAWSTDVVGDERYTIRVKDLRDGRVLDDEIVGAVGGATWDREGVHLYYTTVDESWRADKIWRHRLGTAQDADELVHHETDARFWVGIGRSRSDRFLMIASGSKTTSEYRVLDADHPEAGFRVFSERHEGLEYSLDHAVLDGLDRFLVLHNHTGADFELGDRPGRADRPGGVGAAGAPRPRRPPRGRRRVRRAPRRAPAQRRADPAAHPRARRRRRHGRLPRRVRRGGLHGRLRQQPRLRAAHRAPGLHLDGDPVVGLRLRRAHARAHPAQARARARRLRPGRLRGAPPLGADRGRRAGADLDRLPARRPRHRRGPHADPGAPLRLRRLRGVDGPLLLRRPALAARPGRGLRHRARARRRRDGPALVRRGQAVPQAEQLLRLRRLRPPPHRDGLDHPGAPGRRGRQRGRAAGRARSPTRRRSCSGASSPACRSWTR